MLPFANRQSWMVVFLYFTILALSRVRSPKRGISFLSNSFCKSKSNDFSLVSTKYATLSFRINNNSRKSRILFLIIWSLTIIGPVFPFDFYVFLRVLSFLDFPLHCHFLHCLLISVLYSLNFIFLLSEISGWLILLGIPIFCRLAFIIVLHVCSLFYSS